MPLRQRKCRLARQGSLVALRKCGCDEGAAFSTDSLLRGLQHTPIPTQHRLCVTPFRTMTASNRGFLLTASTACINLYTLLCVLHHVWDSQVPVARIHTVLVLSKRRDSQTQRVSIERKLTLPIVDSPQPGSSIHTQSSDNVEDASWESHLLRDDAHLQAGDTGELTGLQDEAVASSQSRGHLPGRHEVWVVPVIDGSRYNSLGVRQCQKPGMGMDCQ